MLSLTLVVWRLTILMSDFTDFVQFLIEGARPTSCNWIVWSGKVCPTLPSCLWSDTGICPSLWWQTGHLWTSGYICLPDLLPLIRINTHRNEDLPEVVTVAHLVNRFSCLRYVQHFQDISASWNILKFTSFLFVRHFKPTLRKLSMFSWQLSLSTAGNDSCKLWSRK